MSPEQIDRAAEALWRADARRTIDWLEAPRRERNEALRRAQIALDAAGPRVDNEKRALEANAVLATANLQLKAELVAVRRDIEALISARIRGLHERAAAEGLGLRQKRSLHQRAEELGSLLGDLRAARKETCQ